MSTRGMPNGCVITSERQIADMQADGKLTDDEAEELRMFMEFLRHAGPPKIKDQPSPDGKTPGQRLVEAGREDLLQWAIDGRQP